MPDAENSDDAGDQNPRRLYVYNGGFLTQGRVRRILELSGWDIRLGKPGPGDWVGVWGQSPTAPRGEAVASLTASDILRVEDTFLRSVKTGRDGDLPIGLNLDTRGVHFDPSTPSGLEHLLITHPLDDTALLDRARAAADRLRVVHLSKYNAFDPATRLPKAPYVLVIDQTQGDASVTASGANDATFKEMLVFAQTEHPGSRIVIKAHPETSAGHRSGYYSSADVTSDRIELLTHAVSPWALMEGATAVYTVSSQMGFEAIFAGHQPRVFGQPFYAGWGLTRDEYPVPRRERHLTRAQLFAAAMILYPVWYDPFRDQLCNLETAIDNLDATARAWRDDHRGYVARGMRRWKRRHLRQMFGPSGGIAFGAEEAQGRKVMVWGRPDDAPEGVVHVEDGFLRSRGLGAALVPPLSLVLDDLGIYYDPSHESRLEKLINASPELPAAALRRAERLMARITAAGLSKYNLPAATLPALPDGHLILVPGQVEDDASVLLGCDGERTNRDLLARTRAENPDAVIIYKPHPDVEAGLRAGRLNRDEALQFADLVVEQADPAALISAVDEVWTLTSALGYEALLLGRNVTCLGAPFYAGWGLTRDLGKVPARRTAKPTLTALVHAVLIDYPRYRDPVTGLACPVEVIVERLESGNIPKPALWLRALSRLQRLIPG